MRLENLSTNKQGFLLMEVLLAIMIVGMLAMPVYSLISRSLRISSVYSREGKYLSVSRNLMTEQMVRAIYGRKQKGSAEKKMEEPPVSLKYSRGKIPKEILPEKQIGEAQIKNLCRQEVLLTRGREQEKFFSLLYIPE